MKSAGPQRIHRWIAVALFASSSYLAPHPPACWGAEAAGAVVHTLPGDDGDEVDSKIEDEAAVNAPEFVKSDAASEPLTIQDPYSPIEVVRERYPNRRVKIEREVTLDADGNYVNHGTWKMWNEEGKLVAEGQHNLGERTGVWTKWHTRHDAPSLREFPFTTFQEPFVSQATFDEGQLDGDWLIFDAKQRKCSQITFRNGKRHGPAIMWLAEGEVYREAMYEDNVPVGDVMQLDKNRTMSKVASYVDGRRLITKVNNFPGTKNKKTEAMYLDARSVMTKGDEFWNARFAEFEKQDEQLRHGTWKTWYSNGQIQLEGAYRNDMEVGTFTWWHPNGQKAVRGEYGAGLQQGTWVWWHANGQKATTGKFREGRQVGLWRRWGEDGQLQQQTAFNENQPQSEVVGVPASDSQPLETGQKFPILPWMHR